MNKGTREALDAYYHDAESWARDRRETQRRSERIAWIVAGVAATVALLEAFALIMLTPLKTTVPYAVLVDRHTGHVQAVNPLAPERISGDAALTQAMLAQYVIARESFAIDSLQANYRKVALWSAERARADYIAGMQASHPQSPLARYPRDAVVETHVKSVSPVAPNVVLARFETRLLGPDGQTTPVGAWVATIRYRFTGEPMRVEDRFVNPLGFQVVRYRRDPEALVPESVQRGTAPPTPPAAAPAAPAAPQQAPPAPPPAPEVEL